MQQSYDYLNKDKKCPVGNNEQYPVKCYLNVQRLLFEKKTGKNQYHFLSINLYHI